MEKNTLSLREEKVPLRTGEKTKGGKSPSLIWEAPEFEHRPKTKDWYWIVWIICVFSSAASFMIKNYSFAVLILIIGGSISILGSRIPKIIQIKMDQKGVFLRDKFYPFSKIESFNINQEDYKLILKHKSNILPVIVIPLNSSIQFDAMSSFLENFIEFDPELSQPFFEVISEKMGL